MKKNENIKYLSKESKKLLRRVKRKKFIYKEEMNEYSLKELLENEFIYEVKESRLSGFSAPDNYVNTGVGICFITFNGLNQIKNENKGMLNSIIKISPLIAVILTIITLVISLFLR